MVDVDLVDVAQVSKLQLFLSELMENAIKMAPSLLFKILWILFIFIILYFLFYFPNIKRHFFYLYYFFRL